MSFVGIHQTGVRSLDGVGQLFTEGYGDAIHTIILYESMQMCNSWEKTLKNAYSTWRRATFTP